MTKRIEVVIRVSYEFKGQFLKDYLGWLDTTPDSKSARKWFAIDQLIGHEQLSNIDKKATTIVKEIN